jgi:tRNA(adenine34) deaminase
MGMVQSSIVRNDEWFMQQALAQARKAARNHEVPVGALVVDARARIVGRAYNQTVKRQSPLAHAELLAITKAARRQGDWRLAGCTLYVTIEPCALCMHAIIASRIVRVVYGAPSPLYGFSLDKYCSFDLYKKPLAITSGVAAKQAQQYLKLFFKQKRKGSWHTKNSRKLIWSRQKRNCLLAKKSLKSN